MNVWKLTCANNLSKFEENGDPVDGALRVRITKVYINSGDIPIYRGQFNVKYPLIMGRYAVGIVADDNSSTRFPKNTRVLLHNFLSEGDAGTEERTFTEDEYTICGQTGDGFLRDFVYVKEGDMTPLPEAVSDEKALLLPLVALAKATIETLGVQRGQHIAVIGANTLGIFVSRLLIYQQAAPLLIDSRRDLLEFARNRGVYYTSLIDGELMGMIGTLTGGRLADGVVYIMGSVGEEGDLPLRVCAPEKHIAFAGHSSASFSLEMSDVIKKRVTVHGICDGTEYLESAINLVANKAVDLSAFNFITVPVDKIGALLSELSSSPDRPAGEVRIVNMV